MPGELLPFKKGAFHVALQTGAAIVPVAIKNTDYNGQKEPASFPGTMEIVLLPPIETEGLSAETDLPDLLNKTRSAIAERIYKVENGKRTSVN
jgi:1-acyl-sn-glycerol-3-phosphate acyltransferase